MRLIRTVHWDEPPSGVAIGSRVGAYGDLEFAFSSGRRSVVYWRVDRLVRAP